MRKFNGMVLFLVILSNFAVVQIHCQDSVTYAGKIYHTLKIGNQIWMKENLEVGRWIQNNQVQTNNGQIEKYYQNNDSLTNAKYGALYRWDEAMEYSKTPGMRGICPPGWHIPTREEFQELISFVGNSGNALKEINQGVGLGLGTNSSGFSALLSGHVANYLVFLNLNITASFWSSNETSPGSASYMYLFVNTNDVFIGENNQGYCLSIRCIKDNSSVAVSEKMNDHHIEDIFLLQNYPNPFNPVTTIKYSLPKAAPVVLSVYDLLGREVKRLVESEMAAGEHSVNFDAGNLASGTYIYTIKAGEYRQTKKMTVIK